MSGMIGTWTAFGASTATNAAPRSESQSSVDSTRSDDTQPRWRNSTATPRGRNPSISGPSSSSSRLLGENAGVSWSRNAPSLPARSRGAAASSVRSISSRSSPGVSRTLPRALVSTPSRTSGGSDSISAECRDRAL